MTFDVAIVVTLKPVVNDPQGIVVRNGLRQLGFNGVGEVRVGKYIELTIEAEDEDQARDHVTKMCEKLLRNPVIEDYRIEMLTPAEAAR